MKKILFFAVTTFLVIACNNKTTTPEKVDTRIALHSDTMNIVKLSDTLVIFESTCRGCEFEESTRFDIVDTLGLVKLDEIITTDNNPPEMDGGSISKTLVLTPVKTGETTVILYKKYGNDSLSADDSAKADRYHILIQN